MFVVFETGVETPNILESGSSYDKMYRTSCEIDAFRAYGEHGRNYLKKIVVYEGHRKTFTWNPESRTWDD